MSDVAQPGEMELRTDPPPTTVVEPAIPAPEPLAEPAAEPEPVAEVAAEPEPVAAPDKPKKPSMLEELITERTLRKQAETRLREANPVLSRLTPDVQQAIEEGRVVIQPPRGSADAEKTRLEGVARDLGLFKADNTPDLEAAGRVDRYVRGAVKAEVEPVRNMSLADKAYAHANEAVAWAKQQGMDEYSVNVVQEEFGSILHQPNGAQLLSDPKVAKTVWRQAMGRLVEEGRFSGKPPKAPEPAKPQTQAAIITEPTGRRGPAAAAITLSPALAKVYRDNGLDPAKAGAPTVDARGHMELK